jgi:hypothetical protein
MDLSFLLFVFFVLGEEGWGRQVCFSFLFFCVLLFFFLLGFLMPYKSIVGGGGEDLAIHGDLWTLEIISPGMDGNKLDLGWKEMYLRMETNLTWDGKKCTLGWKQT